MLQWLRLSLSSLLILLAAAAHAQEKAAAPAAPPDELLLPVAPEPTLQLITASVPANGSLLFRLNGDTSSAGLDLVDAGGSVVSGELRHVGPGLLAFRPSEPLLAGQSYLLRLQQSFGRLELQVVATEPVLGELQIELDVEISYQHVSANRRFLCCYEDAERNQPLPCSLQSEKQYVGLRVHPATQPEQPLLSSGQLLGAITIQGNRSPSFSSWPPAVNLTIPTPDVEYCAQLHLLDLRTWEQTTGPEVCEPRVLDPAETVYELGTRLDAEVCPAPDFGHVAAWCAYNQARCADGSCAHYAPLCGSASNDAGVEQPPPDPDAGASQHDASAQPEAGRLGGLRVERTEGDLGCHVGASPRVPGPCWLLLIGLLLGRATRR